MGKKVAFATTNWKDRPNKPSGKTQAEWDAESSSGFSGFPFPIYVGKKWTNEMNYFRRTDTLLIGPCTESSGYYGPTYSSSFYFTSVNIGDQSVASYDVDLAYENVGGCNDLNITIVSHEYGYQKKISGWMEPKTLDPIEGPKDEYEYPDYNIENPIPQGVSTKKRFIIGDFSGFFGPFTRDDITRFYWTNRRYSLSSQVQRNSTTPNTRIVDEISYYTAQDYEPWEDEIKEKVKGEALIVWDIDSPSDFYIYYGNYGLSFRAITADSISYYTIDDGETSISYFNRLNNIGSAVVSSFAYQAYACPETYPENRYMNVKAEYTLIGHPMSNYSVNVSGFYTWGRLSFLGEFGTIETYSASSTVENVNIPLYLWPGKVVNIESTKITAVRTATTATAVCANGGLDYVGPGPTPSMIITQEPELEVVRFLEYGDGNGNPIYDKYTGAILRDPVTGEAQE